MKTRRFTENTHTTFIIICVLRKRSPSPKSYEKKREQRTIIIMMCISIRGHR